MSVIKSGTLTPIWSLLHQLSFSDTRIADEGSVLIDRNGCALDGFLKA